VQKLLQLLFGITSASSSACSTESVSRPMGGADPLGPVGRPRPTAAREAGAALAPPHSPLSQGLTFSLFFSPRLRVKIFRVLCGREKKSGAPREIGLSADGWGGPVGGPPWSAWDALVPLPQQTRGLPSHLRILRCRRAWPFSLFFSPRSSPFLRASASRSEPRLVPASRGQILTRRRSRAKTSASGPSGSAGRCWPGR